MTDEEYAAKFESLFLLWEPKRSNVVALCGRNDLPAPLAEQERQLHE